MILNKYILRLSWCYLFICAICLPTTCKERPVLFPIEQNSRWGYIDASGKTVIEPGFESAEEFSEGLAAVRVGELWGYIDTTGKLVIEPRYSGAYSFSEGLARVQVGGDKYRQYGKWGFIDHTGAMVIEAKFEDLTGVAETGYNFHDGLAMIEIDHLHGFIDKKGNTIIAPRFAFAYPFSEGLASVSEGPGKKWGYIDTSGRWAIPPKFEWSSSFTNGLAPVSLNGVCGYVDRSGEVKLQPKFKLNPGDDCPSIWGSFDDGLSRWKIGDKYGFINKAGEVVIRPTLDLTFNFSEGLAFVVLNGKYGFIDLTGRMAIEPQFYFANDFHNGLARVGYSREGWGYINKSGEFVWKKDASAVPAGAGNAFLQTGHTRDITFVGWSPDGNLLASHAADGRIKIWNANKGQLIWSVKARDLGSYPLKSPDGKMLASRATDDAYEIRDAQGRELIWTIKKGSASPRRVTSPDGLTIAERGSYGDACVTLFDARTNQPKGRLEGHPGIVFAIAYGPDGKTIASGSSDKSIRFWDARTGALVKTLVGHSRTVTSLVFSADGKTLVSGGEDDTLKVWNLSDGTLLRSIPGHSPGMDAIISVTLRSDARIAAAGSRDEIKIWELASGKQLGSLKAESDVRSVSFNANGTLIASVHEDGTIKLWDARSFKLIRSIKGRFPDLYAAVFSPNGKFIAAGYNESDSRVSIWSVPNGRFTGRLSTESDYAKSLAFSAGGTMMVTGHMSDDVKLWNLKTRKLIRKFRQPFSMDDQVAFSPDGRYVVSGGENQNVMLWNVRTGQLVWSAVPIDWEAEKRSELASQQRIAAVAAAEADKRNQTVAADKEISGWRDRITITFDHYGEPINPLQQRMMERGTPNKSLTVQTPAEATGVWLRLRNNSTLPIRFRTDSLYLPRPECGVKLSNGSVGPGLCDGAEISIQYEMLQQSTRTPMPYGVGFSTASVLPPGAAILFSVRRDHLTTGGTIFVTYSYVKENEKHELDGYGTDRRVMFRSSELPK